MGLFDRVKNWLAGRDEHGRIQRRPASAHPIKKIEREVLELIINGAKTAHPNEFAGCMRANGDTITEIMLVPGTVQGAAHAIMKINELPIDRSVVGVVHSHPSQSARPSQADINLFAKHGHTHVIIHHPYTMDTWRAWDHTGAPIRLQVI